MNPVLHRICRSCGETKELSSFVKKKDCRLGRGSLCKPCANARAKTYKSYEKDARRRRFIEKMYGIAYEDFLNMYTNQGSKCKVCSAPLELDNTNFRGVNVDHCHTTGRVRGLLCQKCNHGLGLFRDNPFFLQKAIEYLQGGI